MKYRSLHCLFLLVCFCTYLTPVWAVDRFVTLTEYTPNGKAIPLRGDYFRDDVDINSYVGVRFHPEVLAQYCQETKTPHNKRQAEIDALQQFLSASRVQWNTFAERMDTLYRELQTHPTPTLVTAFRQQLAQQGTLIESLLDLLEPVVGLEQLDAALSTPDPLYRDLFRLVSEYIAHVQDQLTAETMQMIRENQLVLRVWCIHQSKDQTPAAVHLNHYDTLEAGLPQMVDKLSLTPEDQQRLQANVRFYEDLLTMTQELGQHKGNLLGMFEELIGQLDTGLKMLQPSLQFENSQQAWIALKDEVVRLASLVECNDMKGRLLRMTEAYQQLSELHQRYKELRQRVGETKNTNPLLTYARLIHSLDAFQKQLSMVTASNIPGRLISEVEDFTADLAQKGDVVPPALQEKAATWAQVTKTWATQFTAEVTQNGTGALYADLFAAAKGLSSRLSYTDVMAQLPVDNTIPKAAQRVILSEVQPTIIDIPRTLRQAGDIYTLYVQVYKGEIPLIRQEYTIRVQPYGIYNTWKSGLLFVKTEGEKAFQPTTGLSWILHYRPRPEQGWLNLLFSEPFHPGIGLNSIMFFDKTEVQYGLGMTMSFFNDLLQVGYGIHLQRTEEEGRNYVFVGASLLDLLQLSTGP